MVLVPIAALALSYALYLLCAGHYSLEYSYDEGAHRRAAALEGDRIKDDGFTRDGVYIPVGNDSLHAWLYSPSLGGASKGAWPLVVMGHGLGAQKDMGLANYASAFTREGLAVLVVDYRTFGGSISQGNSYRNLINPWNHVEDILAAISAVRDGSVARGVADVSRLFLWGTSFAGGHMLVAASRLREQGYPVKGVISQVPHLDGRAASLRSMKKRGVVGCARVLVLALADFARSLLGMSPVYVKIAGVGDETAYMSMTDDEYKIYLSKHPHTYIDDGDGGRIRKYQYMGGWQNKAPARTLLLISRYSPIAYVPQVDVPVLFIGSTTDLLCPIDIVRRAQGLLPHKNSELLELDCSHSGVYLGAAFDAALARMIDFVRRNM